MKKGFTLIELLAVIVILAILALIVSPIISGVITNAKLSAAERSLEGYVQSVELAEVKYQAKNQGNITKDLQELVVEGKSIDKIKYVTVSIDDSGIVNGVLAQVDGYFCNYKKAESAICKLEKDFSGVLQLDFLDSLALNKNRVSSIELIYGINTNMDSLIDVSEEQQDKIMAYKVQDINTLYKIYIMADNYIKLPVDASGMFERYGNLDYIKFNNMIDTSDTVYMGGMFNHTDLLSETLDLTSFDTSKVEY